MDPFTQRMLERARLRQEKLASMKLLESTNKLSPLKENNHKLETKTEVEVPLNTLKTKERCNSVEVVEPKSETAAAVHQDEENTPIKECSKNNVISDKVQSRLKQLAALYADSQLSSPIHQTEGSFSVEQKVEEVPQAQELPKLKFGKSIAKLTELANNMKEWEDDLK